jgi:hypothetical protein
MMTGEIAMRKPQILGDHKTQGRILLPPFVHMLGPLQEVSWINQLLPEFCWIGLIQYEYGLKRSVELITSLARTARSVRPIVSHQPFATATSYLELSDSEWTQLRDRMAAIGNLSPIQDALEPLIALYPECPLRAVFAVPVVAAPENALSRMTDLVSSLFHRHDRDVMMIQATVISLAFDAGMLKVQEGLALAQFPKIEDYPDTEISREIGASIRATLTGFLGKDGLLGSKRHWP